MILDLESVSSGAERVSGDEVVSCDVFGEEGRVQCHIEVQVRRVGDTYYIHVDLTGYLSTACHRCLEPAELQVAPAFDLVVQRSRQAEASSIVSGDEDFLRIDWDVRELSLDRHIFENLVLSIPIQVFCRDDCQGLCSGCGANLNRETCRCQAESENRWQALEKLRDSLPES